MRDGVEYFLLLVMVLVFVGMIVGIPILLSEILVDHGTYNVTCYADNGKIILSDRVRKPHILEGISSSHINEYGIPMYLDKLQCVFIKAEGE